MDQTADIERVEPAEPPYGCHAACSTYPFCTHAPREAQGMHWQEARQILLTVAHPTARAAAAAAALVSEFDRRGAIEQRAQAEARATDETVSTTARYILGEPTSR